ncbi:excitatory amino acid transporter-like [Lineus longissimus]|uniref:excitatory amino acid transporter-like n=1 Tax=Lineus longissimus TaxID=88925 RepID=UPI002B4D7466
MGLFHKRKENGRMLPESDSGAALVQMAISMPIDRKVTPRCQRIKKLIKKELLLILTAVGIVLGFTIGFVVREFKPSTDTLGWLGLPGDMFLRLLKMMILPLIVSCVIAGTASMDPKSNGKISLLSFLYIVMTNIISCALGVTLCLLIKPGSGVVTNELLDKMTEILQTQDIFADLIRNIVPDNVFGACIEKTMTKYGTEEKTLVFNTSDGIVNKTVQVVTKAVGHARGTNLIGIIFACLVFGMATRAAGEKGKPFLHFFQSCSDIVIKIMRWFLWYTPIGVCSLIASSIAGVSDIESTFAQLGFFILVVVAGIVIHQLIIVQVIYIIVVRENPFPYYISLFRPWLTGFATTSTAVAIPEMYKCCDRKKIDSRVSRFVIPFSVTLNADGSAIFIASAAIFIAQLNSIALDPGQVVVIGALTSVAVMALPSVPSSSIVTLVIILSSIGLPTRDIALLFTVEWFLDRIRTTGNVVSHCYCAAFTNKLCSSGLDPIQDGEKPSKMDDDDYGSSSDMDIIIASDSTLGDEEMKEMRSDEGYLSIPIMTQTGSGTTLSSSVSSQI